MNGVFSAWDMLIEKQKNRAIIAQIRAEIEQLDEIPSRFGLPKVLKTDVLNIIDKYAKGAE